MKKLWYQWDEMRRDVNTLCRDITLDKFDPQVIVGLSRGGTYARCYDEPLVTETI